MTFVAAPERYDRMPYNRVGRSGLKLPALSLGARLYLKAAAPRAHCFARGGLGRPTDI